MQALSQQIVISAIAGGYIFYVCKYLAGNNRRIKRGLFTKIVEFIRNKFSPN